GLEVPPGGTLAVDLYISTGEVLSGTIRDRQNGLTIGRAQVRLDSLGGTFSRESETGPDGRYRFDLLPGRYKISVRVPALGVAGDYFSLANPYYRPDSVVGLDVGTSPLTESFELSSNTVVLVHGIFATDSAWGKVSSPEADATLR